MACIEPPELQESALLAFIDGEGSRQVKQHVNRCSHCGERTAELARLQGGLTAQFYRVSCPSPDELGAYRLGMLRQDQAAAIDFHLEDCPLCQQEMAQLESYLQAVKLPQRSSPVAQVGEQLRILVARLVNEISDLDITGQSGLAPAYGAIRGGDEAPLVYQADGLQIVLDAQEDSEVPDRLSLLGLVLGEGQPQELATHLWRENKKLGTVPVDELGNFVFAALASGAYELIISGLGIEIHIQDLVI